MSKVEELEQIAAGLTPWERARLAQRVTRDLNLVAPGITKTPGVCGGQACIAGTRMSVWGLEASRRLGFSDRELIDDYPIVDQEDLANAWRYVGLHLAEIEQCIRRNDDA